MITAEQKETLDELEKLAEEMGFPKEHRKDWRWIKRHSYFFAKSGSKKLERMLALVKKMVVLSHDCLVIDDDDRF